MRFTSSILTQWVKLLPAVLLVPILIPDSKTWAAEQVHISHCAEVCPDAGAPREIVIHHLYAAAIDPDSGLPEWVAYRVLGSSVGVASLLPRSWQPDPMLDETPEELVAADEISFVQPDLSDAQDREYRVNELIYPTVARGRLAPMTSFAGTPYWGELNNLSNMAPLPADLRTGSWARLEQRINALAAGAGEGEGGPEREREVFVVTGPLVPIDAEIAKPRAYFKVVRIDGRVGAFVFPDDLSPHSDYCEQMSSLPAIEAATGLTLFPSLPTGYQGLEEALGCNGSGSG